MQTLKEFDMCCSIVGLNYGGNRRYKSSVGGVLSICIVLATLGITLYYLESFINRKSTKMSFEELKYWDPPELNLSKGFYLAITTKFNGTPQIREDILKIRAYYYTEQNSVKSLTLVDSVPCNISDYKGQEQYYQSLQLDSAICFNFTDKILKGNSVTKEIKYIQIKFLLCLEGKECYMNGNIESLFENDKPIAYMYFLDHVFQGNNRKEMVVSFMNYLEVNVTYNNAKVTNVYFSKNEMNIDDSYFFPTTPKKISKYMVDYFRDLVSVRTKNQVEALSINLLSSKNQQVISISYMQLSELLANVSALVNVIIFIFTSAGEYINHFIFQNDLLSALYSFKDDNKKLATFKKKLKKIKAKFEKTPNGGAERSKGPEGGLNIVSFDKKREFRSPQTASSQFSTVKTLENLNSQAEVIESYESNKPVQSKFATKKPPNGQVIERAFTIPEIICLSISSGLGFLGNCGKCGKLKQKYFIIQKQIFLFQEMIHVFQKLQEIDLLKFLLLNERQQNLYKVIPKPMLKFEEEKDKKRRRRRANSFSSFYNKKETHYLKTGTEIMNMMKTDSEKAALFDIFKSKNRSEIDEKLFHIFEERFMDY